MDLVAGVHLSEAPSPPRFLFEVVKQFCGFGIWSNTKCITPILSTQPDPPPPPYKLYETIPLYLFTQGRGNGGR